MAPCVTTAGIHFTDFHHVGAVVFMAMAVSMAAVIVFYIKASDLVLLPKLTIQTHRAETRH